MPSAASFEHAAPSAELACIVNCFWEVRVHQRGAAQSALIVPDGSHELVVEMGRFEQRQDAQGQLVGIEAAVMAGQLTHAFELGTPSGYHAFGIRLHAWGAAALLGDDLPAITNQAAPMQAVLGARGRVLAGTAAMPTRPTWRVTSAPSPAWRPARWRSGWTPCRPHWPGWMRVMSYLFKRPQWHAASLQASSTSHETAP